MEIGSPATGENQKLHTRRTSSRTTDADSLDGRIEDVEVRQYRKSLFLANESTLSKREELMRKEKERIKPYELSTHANAGKFQSLPTDDLKASFCDLWATSYEARVVAQRTHGMPKQFANWLCIDLCRRCAELYTRFQREYVARNSNQEAFKKWLHQAGYGKRYFNKSRFLTSPILDADVRARLIDFVGSFGDEICLCIEFVDLYEIASMDEETFQNFYCGLEEHRQCIISALSVANDVFKGTNPVKPFKEAKLLNP